jgi:hypothetical protein
MRLAFLGDGQALGRSRSGFWTKIHFKVDRDGLPLAFPHGGEAGDNPQFETLLDPGPYITPRAGVSDKGCTSASKTTARRHASAASLRRSRTSPMRRTGLRAVHRTTFGRQAANLWALNTRCGST